MHQSKSFIKFLGTAGARFVMIEQLRSSGGLWLKHKRTSCSIDPGPGALVRCIKSRPRIDPYTLDGVILTHKHLDHAGDVNVMIEAMTGGLRRNGVLFAPRDCFGAEGVVYSYLEPYLSRYDLETGRNYELKDIRFEAAASNKHTVQTFSLKFFINGTIIGLVPDTAYYEDLESIFDGCDILICNTVFYEPHAEYQHLSFFEAVDMIKRMHIGMAVLTHFGRGMLAHLKDAMKVLKKEKLETKIKLAYDGMTIPL